MGDGKLESLVIDGLGNYPGGTFNKVTISGKGKITGDISCNKLDIAGMGEFEGDLESEQIKASGMGKIDGLVKAEKVEVAGTLECTKSMEIEKFCVAGLSKVKQCLKAESIEITGMLTVEGNIEAEKVSCEGILKCEGFLNCETIEIDCKGVSKLNEVGAASICVEGSSRIKNGVLGFLLPDFLKDNKVVANVIEGDNIELDHCEAKVVRGKNITLGPGCKIALVEYSGKYEADDKAQVDQVNKI